MEPNKIKTIVYENLPDYHKKLLFDYLVEQDLDYKCDSIGNYILYLKLLPQMNAVTSKRAAAISKSPRLVLNNQQVKSATPDINKKRIKLDEPAFQVRPTKTSLMLRDVNTKKALNLSGDISTRNYSRDGIGSKYQNLNQSKSNLQKKHENEMSPQKSYRDLNKKWVNDELSVLTNRYSDLGAFLEPKEWAKLLRPKLKTLSDTIECLEEIFTARHSYERKFPNKFTSDRNELTGFILELYDAKFPNSKMKTQNVIDLLHSVNHHRHKVPYVGLFDSFLRDEYECLIHIFFLLLRSKTESTLNIKFYKNDRTMVGRTFADPLNVKINKSDALTILDLTFEEQVGQMKAESAELLELYFNNNRKMLLYNFYSTIIKYFNSNLGDNKDIVVETDAPREDWNQDEPLHIKQNSNYNQNQENLHNPKEENSPQSKNSAQSSESKSPTQSPTSVVDYHKHIWRIAKSVIDDNEVYQKFIRRYLTWMKLNPHEVEEYSTAICAQVGKRLDTILEVPLKIQGWDEFQRAWLKQLGFEDEENDIVDSDEFNWMRKVWSLSVHIKNKFPSLATSNQVRDFAKIEMYDYINVVLETKELNKHLMSYIEDYVEERNEI